MKILFRLAVPAVGATVLAAGFGVGKHLFQAQSSEKPCLVSVDKPIIQDQAVYDQTLARFSNSEGRKIDLGPAIACFAPGTPEEVIQAFTQAMENAEEGAWPSPLSPQYQLNTRWNIGSQGDPITLRWSFVPDGLSISNGIGEGVAPSNLFAQMDAQFGGNRALWISKFTAVFNRWSALSGITYQRVTAAGVDWDDGAAWGTAGSATRGDVRISMKFLDGNAGVLAYNFFPQTGDMVLDSGDIARWGNASGDYLQLRNVVAHEHGHGQGISHVCPIANSKLMEPFLSTAFDGPQHDDIRASQRHYGDRSEPNNSTAAATDLGAIAVGAGVTRGPVPAPTVNFGSLLSIDANGENDYFRFTIPSGASISVNVTPIGTTYGDNAQNTNCTQTATVNSLAIANLAIDLIDSNGATVLSTAAGQATGLAENITRIWRQNPGTYYVRVYETDTPTQCQLYHLTVNVLANAAPILGAIGNKVVNEESNLAFVATSTDADNGQARTYSLVGAPGGATIDANTGAFSWTPSEAQGPGNYPIEVRVTDSAGAVDSEIINVQVNEVNKVVSGTVNLGDFVGSVTSQTVTFEVRSVGFTSPLETKNVVLGPGGTFSFTLTTVNAGVYDVTAKGSHWLRKKVGSVAIAPTGAAGLSFTLANGDADGDNEVGIGDYAVISGAYNTSLGDAGFNVNADLNGDDAVDIADYAILSSKYGMNGDD
ncbi:MAG: putative Ig domain-containing protein [Fimbriimonadaceae bacterium]|nr:putative Ig domain-containing protein [Fimbriimonadaceae bacterium]